jgi:hypothetical protein
VTRTYERGTATRSTPIPGIQSSPSRVNRFARSGGGTAAHGLHDLVAVAGPATRCGRERIPTTAESAIRARFVRDSFHRLSTELITALSRRIVWYRRRRAAVKKRAGACWMFRAISINERCNRAGCRVAGRNRILSAREDEPSRQSDPVKGWWTCRTSLRAWVARCRIEGSCLPDAVASTSLRDGWWSREAGLAVLAIPAHTDGKRRRSVRSGAVRWRFARSFRDLLAVVVQAIAISITSCTSGWNRRLPGMGEAGIFPSSEMQRAATALLDRWHKPERAARPVICYSWRVSLRLSQGRR